MTVRSKPVRVFGVDHSPWVQAVLLGLFAKQIPAEPTTVPPLKHFLRHGVLMPAAQVNRDDWQLESSSILESLGYDAVSSDDLRQISIAWIGVLHRADNPLEFFRAFSKAGDLHTNVLVRLLRNFLRSFATFYFFCIISFRVWQVGHGDPQDYGEQFLYWEKKLASTAKPFLGGDQPDAVDCLLFGVVQCHCTIAVPPLTAMEQDERLDGLRHWLRNMNQRFADYPHLYSGQRFGSAQSMRQPASAIDQGAYWLGLITWFLALPVTLPLVALLAWRVRRRMAKK